VSSFEPVERFLGAEGLSAILVADGPMYELQIYPVGGTRATSRQRRDVETAIDRWSEAVATYLDRSIALYAHLERRPDRAVPCLSHVVDEHGQDSGPLDPREERLVVELKSAIDAVADILMVPDDQAFSANELSRLAFDPFPARLTVSVDGRLVSSDGFLELDGVLERPRVDLWTSLLALNARWLSPDLVTTMVSPGPDDRQPELDPAVFASLPRRFEAPPGAAEVADALRHQLVPRSVHLIHWRPRLTAPPDFEDTDPRRYLDAAEIPDAAPR
jgi:hypothetical protein